MCEKNGCHVPIWPVLDTALEALLLKLVCERVNWALALTRVPADFGNVVVDILTCR